MSPSDPVNHPEHYTFGKVEVIDVLEDWFPQEPLLWQVGKYIARWSRKGDPLENLKKARFYLDRKITQMEAELERARADHQTRLDLLKKLAREQEEMRVAVVTARAEGDE